MNSRAIFVLGFATLVIAVAGCGGSGNTTSLPVNFTTPIAAPAVNTPPAFSVQSTQSIPTPAAAASSIPIALPVDAKTGSTGSIFVPVSSKFTIPANAAVNESLQSTLDATDPVFQSLARSPESVRALKDSTGRVTLALLRLSFNVTFSLGGGLGITYTVPGTYPTNGVNYYVAFYDPLTPSLGWQQGYESAPVIRFLTLSNGQPGTQFAFAGNANPITFAAYQQYRFLLYAVSAAAPAPTPAPTNVPTIAPSPTPAPVIVAPAALTFASATSAAQTVVASEGGFTGPFTLRGLDNCAGIVSPAQSGATATVTPQGGGACSFFIVGSVAFAQVSVTVGNPTGLTIAIPASPTPSPSPSAVPALPIASPSSITVSTTTTAVISASELGYTGSYFASVADPTIANLNPTQWSLTGPAQFIVSGHIPGTTSVTISDGFMRSTSVGVTVTVGMPSLSLTSSVAAPISIPRTGNVLLSLIYPSYPGSVTTANPPVITPAGCVTAPAAAPSNNNTLQTYRITYVPGAAANCTATVTLSETTAGVTGTATAFVMVP